MSEDWTEIQPERHSILWPSLIAAIAILTAFVYQPLEQEFHRQVMQKALAIANTRAIPEPHTVRVPTEDAVWSFSTPTYWDTTGDCTCGSWSTTTSITENVMTLGEQEPRP